MPLSAAAACVIITVTVFVIVFIVVAAFPPAGERDCLAGTGALSHTIFSSLLSLVSTQPGRNICYVVYGMYWFINFDNYIFLCVPEVC